jgi:hypothetical protein
MGSYSVDWLVSFLQRLCRSHKTSSPQLALSSKPRGSDPIQNGPCTLCAIKISNSLSSEASSRLRLRHCRFQVWIYTSHFHRALPANFTLCHTKSCFAPPPQITCRRYAFAKVPAADPCQTSTGRAESCKPRLHAA